MKPSELLELCMELNSDDFPVHFEMLGQTEFRNRAFSMQIFSGDDMKWFRREFEMMFFYDEHIPKAADWLRKQHEECRSKQ